MHDPTILQPAFALIGLTGAVGVVLLVRRLGELSRQGKSINQFPGVRQSVPEIFSSRTNATGDNFSNLFESPVIFYFLCAVSYATGSANGLTVAAAWTYVILRFLHSAIHLTYNLVSHRFAVFVTSMGCLVVFVYLVGIRIF